MSDEPHGAHVPAGWYPDPQSADHYRWWDGALWTEHVRDREVVVAPYVPMVAAPTPVSTSSAVVIRPPSVPVWLPILVFSLLPLIVVFGPALIANAAPETNEIVVQLALAGVVIVASVIVAVWDGRTLIAHGHPSWVPPHPLFAVVPIVYLVRRVFSVGGLTFVFAVIWAAATIAGYTSQVGDLNIDVTPAATSTADPRVNPPYTAESRAFLLTPDGMDQLIAHLLSTNAQVDCEPLASTEPGEQTTCAATLLLGIETTVVVEVQPIDADQAPLAIISTAAN